MMPPSVLRGATVPTVAATTGTRASVGTRSCGAPWLQPARASAATRTAMPGRKARQSTHIETIVRVILSGATAKFPGMGSGTSALSTPKGQNIPFGMPHVQESFRFPASAARLACEGNGYGNRDRERDRSRLRGAGGHAVAGHPLSARGRRARRGPRRSRRRLDVGDRRSDAAMARELAAHGIAVLSIEFRMPPAARYPATVQDVMAGMRWLKQHAAELGTTPARVGFLGLSSGGHLALLGILRPSDPRYAAGASGDPVDLSVNYAALWLARVRSVGSLPNGKRAAGTEARRSAPRVLARRGGDARGQPVRHRLAR